MEFNSIEEVKDYGQTYIRNKSNYIEGCYALANTFVRSPSKLDVQTMKLFGLILSKIDYKKDNRINGLVEVDCSMSEIRKACGLDTSEHKNYEYYKELAKGLVKASFVEFEMNENEEFIGYAVQQVKKRFDDNKTVFRFRLSNDLLPYFQELIDHYTIVSLENAKQFKSRFSYELYLNLLSWADDRDHFKENTRLYTTKQLKDLFSLDENAYMLKGKFNRGGFEKKTLLVALQEINLYTNMRLKIRKLKDGNRVAAYQFVYSFNA